MATTPIPTIQNSGSAIDQLIAGITKSLGSGGNTSTPGFTKELGALLGQLTSGSGQFSKDAAIADSQGVISQLAQRTLQQQVPQRAAAMRGSGLYNSTTNQLLADNQNAELTAQMAALVQQNIKDYATIDANRVNAAANASRAATTTGAPSTGNVLKSVGTGILLNEGKKLLGGLFDDKKTDVASAATSAVANAFDFMGPPVSAMNDFVGPSEAFAGSGGSDWLGDIVGGVGDWLGDVGGGISDAVGGAVDWLGGLFGFADGGVVPTRAQAQDIWSRTRVRREQEAGLAEPGTEVVLQQGSSPSTPAPGAQEAVMQLLQLLLGGKEEKKVQLEPLQKFADGGTVKTGSQAAAKGGEITGPKSKTGADNMIIAVQGGEGIIPTDVMEIDGIPQLLDALITNFHTPSKGK